MSYIVTATITSLWSIMLQQLLRLYDLYGHSNYYTTMISNVTAPSTSLWSTLLQQLFRLYDLYCYSNYCIFMIYSVTATITSLWSILLQQLLRHDLSYHTTSIRPLSIQPNTSLWSLYPANVSHTPIAATGGPPPDAPCQERPGGRQAKHPRLCFLRYHIVFTVFAICVIRYLPDWRP